MLISVIVPVYNVEAFLEKCVDSLIAQTYQNLEIILVDDGSTDSSGRLCDELKKKDPRIVVVHKENGGLSSARNAGIAVAKGDYFGFVDSDDYVEPDMYETMLKAVQSHGLDIACCGREIDLYGQRTKKEFTLSQEKVYSREEAIEAVLYLQEIDVSACDKLYARHIFDGIVYPHGKISEDAAIIFDILKTANGIVHVGKPFYHYIFRRNSISKSSYSIKKYDICANMDTAISFVNTHYPNLTEACKVYVCSCVFPVVEQLRNDKESKKQYPDHYKKYMEFFNYGFFAAARSKQLPKKTRVQIILLKLHMQNVFRVMKNIKNKILKK